MDLLYTFEFRASLSDQLIARAIPFGQMMH